MSNSAPSRLACKSPEHSLANRLAAQAGLCPAQIRVALDAFADHLEHYHAGARPPGAIEHTAVAADEPAGKPIKHCRVVPVTLTLFDPADVDVLDEQGPVRLREIRVHRLALEARLAGGLLSYEDIAALLGLDVGTVGVVVRRLRQTGIFVPTRGAVQDIGPVPSHKQIIADLLGRGRTTIEVRATTQHSEGAIARYQQQFAKVIFLLHYYPDRGQEDLLRVSELSSAAWDIYAEVYRNLSERDDCRPHLERLRRYHEMDPEGLAQQIPPGKAPDDVARRRLEAQTLATAMRQAVQNALGTTERVAELVSGDLLQLVERSFRLANGLRPGEITFFADRYDPNFISGERQADREVLPVTVPMYTEQARTIWRSGEPASVRRARLASLVAASVWEQGGVMTVEGLAELLHVRPSTLGGDLRNLAAALQDAESPPTKGTVEDAGPTLTHKRWIIDLDNHGLTGEQITWLTRHAPSSRDRYVSTYRRVESLMRLDGKIPTVDKVASMFRLRRHVAQQYVDLLQEHLDKTKTSEASPPSPAAAA